MRPLHLGTRITLWSALVVTASILLCGTVATLLVRHEEIEGLDDELYSASDGFLKEWQSHGGRLFDWKTRADEVDEWLPASDPGWILEVMDENGNAVFRSEIAGPQPFPALSPGLHDFDRNGARFRLLVRHKDGIVLRLAGDTASIDDMSSELAGALLLALPVALAFVFVGARWISRQAMDPVRKITQAAEQVTAQRLDLRVPVPPAHDEIRRLAEVLNGTFDSLDQSFHQATRFTADASHELKTPLTVLRTSVEALLHSPRLDPMDQATVEGLLEQTKRLSSITENLLLLSRADVGKLTLDLHPGDLNTIVNMCVEDARILAEAQSISIVTELPPAAPALMEPIRAAQIVMNLLDNAVKYNVEGGSIGLSLEKAGGDWRLSITNTGKGIPQEVVPNLFTRFYRAEHGSEIHGHGLGLSLSRELARAHHGDILHVPDPEPGVTRFVATFPVAPGNS